MDEKRICRKIYFCRTYTFSVISALEKLFHITVFKLDKRGGRELFLYKKFSCYCDFAGIIFIKFYIEFLISTYEVFIRIFSCGEKCNTDFIKQRFLFCSLYIS